MRSKLQLRSAERSEPMPRPFNSDPRLNKEKAALVLFDVLHGYLHPADPHKEALVAASGMPTNIARLYRGARAAGLHVFYARADHAPDQSDLVPRLTDTTMDLVPWPDPTQPFNHFVTKDTKDAEIAAEVAPNDESGIMVYKHRWSAFFQTSLELMLRARGLDTIVLAGLSTDVGIASTAFAGRDLDFGIVIVRDACYSSRGPNHDFFMDRVFPRMSRVMSTDVALGLM